MKVQFVQYIGLKPNQKFMLERKNTFRMYMDILFRWIFPWRILRMPRTGLTEDSILFIVVLL